jgi:hypothetical protein
VPFHQGAGEPPVGDHVIEVRHHLGLGHDRQARQVGQLERVDVGAGQAGRSKPGCVERRMPGGMAQQRPQRGALKLRKLVRAPVQAGDVRSQAIGQGRREPGP